MIIKIDFLHKSDRERPRIVDCIYQPVKKQTKVLKGNVKYNSKNLKPNIHFYRENYVFNQLINQMYVCTRSKLLNRTVISASDDILNKFHTVPISR